MQILLYFLYHLLTYGLWWLAFIGLVFCAARYTPWPCIPLAFLVVAFLIYYVDFTWVQTEMRKPGWNGTPDLDMIFMFGVLVRIVLVSIILTPVAIVGFRFRRRSRRASQAHTTP
jgi:hypothetical protein